MSSFAEALLKVLTLGLYGRGKASKDVKRYRKDGTIRVDKQIDREGLGLITENLENILKNETIEK